MSDQDELWLAICEGDHATVETIVETRPDLARGVTDDGLPWTLAAVIGPPGIADLLLRLSGPAGPVHRGGPRADRPIEVLIDRLKAAPAQPTAGCHPPGRVLRSSRHLPCCSIAAGFSRALDGDLENTRSTPLWRGRQPVTELLVERGADVNAVAAGLRPHDIAEVREDHEMVEFLIRHGASRGEGR
jgi:hypothetical protein